MVEHVSSERDFGWSDIMGPKLREFVQSQLIKDLNVYLPESDKVNAADVLFDWSESCIEGHRTNFLDGALENFSGVAVLNAQGDLIADGWMEFIETNDSIVCFWWFLHPGENYEFKGKSRNGVPQHIWETLDETAKAGWKSLGLK